MSPSLFVMAKKVNYTDINAAYEILSNSDKKNYFEELGRKIISSVEIHGLGVLPKSDLEALIFHCISNVLEPQYDDDIQKLDYALMQLLKISPSKLRTLRVARSAKFLNNLDYTDLNNQYRLICAFRHVALSSEDVLNGIIKISISDPHTQLLVEAIVEDNQGVVDKALNPKLLVLSSKDFLSMVELIYGKGGNDFYVEILKTVQDDAKKNYDKLTKDDFLKQFQDACKDKALSKLVEVSCSIVTKALKKKLGLE